MNIISMGRVNVAVPGTPIPLSTDSRLRVARVLFQSIPGLTGKTYVGTHGMNKATLSGVIRILAPTGSSSISDTYEVETANNNDGIALSQLFLDADIVGEGLLISYWVE